MCPRHPFPILGSRIQGHWVARLHRGVALWGDYRTWGGSEKSLAERSPTAINLLANQVTCLFIKLLVSARGPGSELKGCLSGSVCRGCFLVYPQPHLLPVLTLGPCVLELGQTAGKGWARSAEGRKVGSKACQGLRDMNGGLTLPLGTWHFIVWGPPSQEQAVDSG